MCVQDQLVKIWKINGVSNNSFELIHTLRGHTTAVTCVDWVSLPNNQILLASCADDKTVRFWNLEEEVPAAGKGKHTKGKSSNRQKPKIRK